MSNWQKLINENEKIETFFNNLVNNSIFLNNNYSKEYSDWHFKDVEELVNEVINASKKIKKQNINKLKEKLKRSFFPLFAEKPNANFIDSVIREYFINNYNYFTGTPLKESEKFVKIETDVNDKKMIDFGQLKFIKRGFMGCNKILFDEFHIVSQNYELLQETN